MDKIEVILNKIEPIIMDYQKRLKVPSWKNNDYLLEGSILALEMFQKFSLHGVTDDFNFYTYFEKHFSQFLDDKISKKQIDKLDYQIASENTHLEVEEQISYKQDCEQNLQIFPKNDAENTKTLSDNF
jgi:hypothetical protein